MSISVKKVQFIKTTVKRYLIAALCCALFSAVYAVFSHGVHSMYMTFLFAWPLVLGAGGSLLRGLVRFRPSVLYHAGIAAFTAGSCIHGVMDIYGTASAWVPPYFIAAVVLIFADAVYCGARRKAGRLAKMRQSR